MTWCLCLRLGSCQGSGNGGEKLHLGVVSQGFFDDCLLSIGMRVYVLWRSLVDFIY